MGSEPRERKGHPRARFNLQGGERRRTAPVWGHTVRFSQAGIRVGSLLSSLLAGGTADTRPEAGIVLGALGGFDWSGGTWGRRAWNGTVYGAEVQISALLGACCMALAKSLPLPQPPFSHLSPRNMQGDPSSPPVMFRSFIEH